MRFILWFCLVLGVLWGAYWVAGSRTIESLVNTWFADQKAAGLVAENGGVSVAGFADRFDLTVTQPHLADPVSGWGWQAPFAQVLSMTWKPWHLIAALPNMQTVTLPDGQKINLGSSRVMASLRMAPTPSLPPQELRIEGSDLTLTSLANWSAGVQNLALAARAEDKDGLRLGVDLGHVTVPEYLAHLANLGPTLSMAHLDATVTLSEPLAWDMPEPQVQAVNLSALQVTWGALSLSGSGSIAPDRSGLAEGKFNLRLKGWKSLPALIVALGLVPPGMQKSLNSGLEFLAVSGSDPAVLDLPLTFKDGMMSLGPLPLGPAPLLK